MTGRRPAPYGLRGLLWLTEDLAPVLLPCPAITSSFRRIGGGVALHRGIPDILPVNQELRLSAPKAFVVRSIMDPDGQIILRQDFVLPGEVVSFAPTSAGNYRFFIGSVFGGRTREVTVKALLCR